MTDLGAIRERSEISAKAVVDDWSVPARDRLTLDQVCSRWYSSAQDVPVLLEIIDVVTPLVVAARNLAHSEGDKDTLEALVEAVDVLPWTVLDMLGIADEGD